MWPFLVCFFKSGIRLVDKNAITDRHNIFLTTCTYFGSHNSSVVCWAQCLAWCSAMGSKLLWGEFFSGRGDFSLEVSMGSDSNSPKRFRMRVQTGSSLCIPLQGLKRSWHSCPRGVNARNKITYSLHQSRRRNVTTPMVGIKKRVRYTKISQNGEPQISSWGIQKKKKYLFFSSRGRPLCVDDCLF